jgi:hypothetical protein
MNNISSVFAIHEPIPVDDSIIISGHGYSTNDYVHVPADGKSNGAAYKTHETITVTKTSSSFPHPKYRSAASAALPRAESKADSKASKAKESKTKPE